MSYFHLSIICCLFITHLQAEIQSVSITWNAPLCQEKCVDSLTKQFYKLKEVQEVDINQNAGGATLKWKPNAPFNLVALKNAMAMIGLYVKEYRVRVRGTISPKKEGINLISYGDWSSFTLLGPLTVKENRYLEENNPVTHPLTSNDVAVFLELAKNQQMVTIEGPLFQPHRAPPLYLIVEQKSIEQAKSN